MGSSHVRRIWSVALRRSGRRLAAERRRLLLLFAGLLVTTPAWYYGARAVYRYGRAWSVGESPIPLAELLTGQLSVLGGVVVVLVVLRTILEVGYPDEPAFVLLAVSAPDVATGLALAEYVRVTLVLGGPLIAVWSVFALGAGSPALVLTGGATLAAFLLACVLGSYLLGLLVTPTLRWIDRRVRYALVAALVAAAMLAIDRVPSAVADATSVLEAPVSLYARLALLGSSAGPLLDPRVAGSIVVAVGLPLAFLGAIRAVTPTVWWLPDRSSDSESTTSVRGGWLPTGRFPSVHVAWVQLLRGVRNPARLGHVFVAAFVLLPTVVSFIGEPLEVALLVAPPLLSVVTAWTAGALFCLNPIGDSAPMYSQLALATVPTRCFVLGRMLAGLAVTLPPASLLIGLAGIAGPITGSQTATLLGFTALLSIWATTVASGLGSLVPATHRSTRADGRTVTTPHLGVIGSYSFLVGVAGLGGLLLVYLPSAFRIVVPSVSTEAIRTWGGIALFGTCVVVAGLSLRYATDRFGRYEIA
ncbi:hypothetical protein [Halopiger goleimassiliensis]|uniref:hypothetical protein n=1 Tax=Halopiger goleimassiliensis TaxID=1293048 RepID=UPI00067831BE|nr:hypothetical protein [Halopiger goleimassiliensis]